MIIQEIQASNCTPQTIVIGRRGTYDTMQIAFDLSFLIENYGSGTAVLAVKRSQDESAYPAVVTQEDATLLWTVNETDTAYVGSGECQLMWYVDGGLAKTIIYPMVVMRDILQTAEEPPEGYENWIEHLTELGAETQQNAQNAAQSASDAEDAKDDTVTAKEAAEAAQQAAETAVTHYPKIENNYWMVWDSTSQSYVSTGIQAEGEDGYSPEITITSITGGHRVIITDKDHPQGQSFDVMDGQGGGTSNYADLSNKPKINNVELNGNKTAHDLGLAAQTDIPTVPVQSVNGKTGAVNLASGDIAYDESATYQAGSVGAELQEQNRQLNELDADSIVYESLTNTGTYTISADDLESGQWSFSRKDNNAARARTKFLIPVYAGMSISYENTTFDVFFGVLETPNSMSYMPGLSGWKTNSNGTFNITADGYLTFVIRNHADTTAEVNPVDFNSLVTIKSYTLNSQIELSVRSGDTTLIINNDQAATILGSDADSAAVNTIYGIGMSRLTIANLPDGANYRTGNLVTLGIRKGNLSGKVQLYITYSCYMYIRSFVSNAWSAWNKLADTSDISSIWTTLDAKTSLITSTMVTTDAIAESMFDKDADNMEPNKLYCIGANGLTISNMPYSGFSGNILSLSFRDTSALSGRMQIAVSNVNRLFTRLHFGGSWKAWKEYADVANVQKPETVYHVGATRENTSLVGLLKTIQTNTDPAVIYIDDGTYDIFAEYKANNIPSPPANVQSADYFNYNVFLPQNCRLVGIGNVELVWNPSTSQITQAESRTWSPLNLWYGGNTVENITIRCKNGRYCLHDDSHNAFTGFVNHYKNVRCIYTESDSGYGFNHVTGFGFEDDCTFEFDNCHFEYVGTGDHGVLYGHDGSTGGASIIVNNSVFLGGTDANKQTIRLQSLRTNDANSILTKICGCYIQGGIRLAQYTASAGQFFDVTLLHSGNPTETVDIAENPYPIKVYN